MTPRYFYVDARCGDDDPLRDGSSCEPLRTLAEVARRGPFDRPIVVNLLTDLAENDAIGWISGGGITIQGHPQKRPMTRKRAEKQYARDIQALTGRSYRSALNLLHEWTARGVVWKDGIASLSKENNERDDERKEGAMHVFRITDGETTYVCAKDEVDARAVYQESMGEAESVQEIEKMPDDRILKVRDDDEGKTIEKTCAEWAKEGRALISSSCF